jgi:hypothetical protein
MSLSGLDEQGTDSSSGHERPRAFLFEAISTPEKVPALIDKYKEKTNTAQKDVGLSVVINERADGDANNAKERVKSLKERAKEFTKTSKGSALAIVPAVWEGSSVPYLRLRQLAARNEGANEILKELRKSHRNTWRRLGDDDMSFTSPNDDNDEINKGLEEAENSGGHLHKMVTFGYNLTSEGVNETVKQLLELVYKKEMELREKIAELQLGVYPIEPNTFYMLGGIEGKNEEKVLKNWSENEKKDGGQSKEGLKLYQAANTKGLGGISQFFKAGPLGTAAGKRNDKLVEYFNQVMNDWKKLTQEKTQMDKEEGTRESNEFIQKAKKFKKNLQDGLNDKLKDMDQSYFNEDVAIKNAELMNGGLKMSHDNHNNIKQVVQEGRNKAVMAVLKEMSGIVKKMAS